MKNRLSLLSLLLIVSFNAMSQNAKVGMVELNKIQQPCVVVDYQIPANLVDGAFQKKFNDLKWGGANKGSDGFRVYKGVVLSEIIKEKMDVYYRVDDKKPTSTVYFLTSRGYDNFMKMNPDSVAIQNTIQYLNHFVKDATAFQLNDQIMKQNDVMKDMDKKAKSAAKEGESLLRKKEKTEAAISKNTIETGTLKSEMENQQTALEQVKTKTVTIDQMNDLKKEVSKQESATKKAIKNYDKSVKEGASLQEDLYKLQKDITDNRDEQQAIKAETEREKAKLDDLKLQLNNLK